MGRYIYIYHTSQIANSISRFLQREVDVYFDHLFVFSLVLSDTCQAWDDIPANIRTGYKLKITWFLYSTLEISQLTPVSVKGD